MSHGECCACRPEKKLSDILKPKQLQKLKQNMKEFAKKPATSWSHGIQLKWIKNDLKDFENITEGDLSYLRPFLQ